MSDLWLFGTSSFSFCIPKDETHGEEKNWCKCKKAKEEDETQSSHKGNKWTSILEKLWILLTFR